MSEDFKKPDLDKETKNNKQGLEIEEKELIDKNQEEKISKPVVIKAEAYKTIILFANRYANQAIPPQQWKEIYGILIGYSDDDIVSVERAEALAFGHSTDVQLDERHYGFIEEIQERLDEEGKGYYMIGWFHSHPGLGLFFSYIDLINQLGFQAKNDDFCGLVFDHTLLGKKKQEKIEHTENVITKYDTGFEIYRLTDPNMDVNAPEYDNNYHKVDYIVEGLNKYFFANVLSELSALFTAGKPLQSAYGEAFKLESSYKEVGEITEQQPKKNKASLDFNDNLNDQTLVDIPLSGDITFNRENSFYGEKQRENSQIELPKETAEQLIYEGNIAFKNKDAFMGVEKYRQGIEKYKELNDIERVLELLGNLTMKCISNDHFVFAEEFAEDLYNLADEKKHLFYRGKGNFLIGYLLLKKGDNDFLEIALKNIRDAAIDFDNEKDFAGAGMCFNKIGTIYQSRLNQLENSCLFYREAIENYNKGILKSHPLRKSLWSKPELLAQKILELKDVVEEIIPNLENTEIKKKIIEDLKSINFNF